MCLTLRQCKIPSSVFIPFRQDPKLLMKNRCEKCRTKKQESDYYLRQLDDCDG